MTNGSVLIYNNNRLCEDEVVNFKNLIEGNEHRRDDYMLNNGNRTKCNFFLPRPGNSEKICAHLALL